MKNDEVGCEKAQAIEERLEKFFQAYRAWQARVKFWAYVYPLNNSPINHP